LRPWNSGWECGFYSETLAALRSPKPGNDPLPKRNHWWMTRIARPLGNARRVLVASAAILDRFGRLHGIGIALLPEPFVSASVGSGVLEVVLPQWSAATHIMHVLYPRPRGMLPSVRSLIEYLTVSLPAACSSEAARSLSDQPD
jgi:DNA-binding transcriptional LysR family regulator